MASRTALITILLVCFSEGTVRADVNWEDGTCEISVPEPTTTGEIYGFTVPGGDNTGYTYTIEKQSVTDQFEISIDGKLSSDTALEFGGSKNPYNVDIIATLTSDTTKSVKVTCAIQVVRLKFVQNTYSVDIVNNVTESTSILTVLATYADVSSNYNVEYSIKEGEDGGDFTMNKGTGVISTNKLLTAAAPPNSKLTVIATDADHKEFTAEASVCVGCIKSGSSLPVLSLFASMTLVFSVLLM